MIDQKSYSTECTKFGALKIKTIKNFVYEFSEN